MNIFEYLQPFAVAQTLGDGKYCQTEVEVRIKKEVVRFWPQSDSGLSHSLSPQINRLRKQSVEINKVQVLLARSSQPGAWVEQIKCLC